MITAKEAIKRSFKNSPKKLERLLQIVEEKIECEIENGNYNCTVNNTEVIEYSEIIVSKLKKLGYVVSYQIDENDRYSLQSLYITW